MDIMKPGMIKFLKEGDGKDAESIEEADKDS